MDAINVTPQKWCNNGVPTFVVLFDDGEYSIIWGEYEGSRAMGVRWNEGPAQNNIIGYPKQGAYPTWYIEPEFMAIGILQRLLNLSNDAIYRPHMNIPAIEETLRILEAR